MFLSISEVAEREIGVPQHMLRYWETQFPQLKPTRRAGGRRYYRAEDIALLRGIYVLLYEDGFAIRGVQKLLREHGVTRAIERGRVASGPSQSQAQGAKYDCP